MISRPQQPPPLDQLTEPILGFRFAVVFFAGGAAPNPIDVRFQKVSGLSATIETTTIAEGGHNLYPRSRPGRVSHGNLVLERGFVVGSPLNLELNAAITMLKFTPCHVMVTLLTEAGVPLAAWLFIKAFPVSWKTADLDAGEERVLIDTLELSYERMQVMRI